MHRLSIRTQIAVLLGVAVGGHVLVMAVCGVVLQRHSRMAEFARLVSETSEATRTAAVTVGPFADGASLPPGSLAEAELLRSAIRRPISQCLARFRALEAHPFWEQLRDTAPVATRVNTLHESFRTLNASSPQQFAATQAETFGRLVPCLDQISGAMSALQRNSRAARTNARWMSRWFIGSIFVVYLAALFCMYRRAANLIVAPMRALAEAAGHAMHAGKPFSFAPKGPQEVQTVGFVVNSLVGGLESSVRDRTTELQTANTNLRLLNATLHKEMSLRKSVEGQLRFEAHHDALTRLPNRHLLMERINYLIERSKRDACFRFAILFLDIDNFKNINDSLGHRLGDALLIEIARRLTACIRSLDGIYRPPSATTARLGGDEFVILLDNVHGEDHAIAVARRIQEQLASPVNLDGHLIGISASIGITVSDGRRLDGHELLRDADTAMYRAKRAGKVQFAVFDETMHLAVNRRLKLENHLRFALERNELNLVFQPIVALQQRTICGFEALLRWHHPDEGVITPSEFIPIAEETGLIVPIGEWVLREACARMRHWRKEHKVPGDLSMSVNVSVRQLLAPNFREQLEAVLRAHQLPMGALNLEVTESLAMGDTDKIAKVLADVKELGVNLHMDDFGTGHSSLTCLHSLPLDAIKIDQSFVRTLAGDHRPTGILAGVMAMARNLNMAVIAEGIEEEAQQGALLTLNCAYGQGFYYCRPVDAESANKLLACAYGDERQRPPRALRLPVHALAPARPPAAAGHAARSTT